MPVSNWARDAIGSGGSRFRLFLRRPIVRAADLRVEQFLAQGIGVATFNKDDLASDYFCLVRCSGEPPVAPRKQSFQDCDCIDSSRPRAAGMTPRIARWSGPHSRGVCAGTGTRLGYAFGDKWLLTTTLCFGALIIIAYGRGASISSLECPEGRRLGFTVPESDNPQLRFVETNLRELIYDTQAVHPALFRYSCLWFATCPNTYRISICSGSRF